MREQIVNTIVEQYPGLEAIYLYGSYAREEQTEHSDIDIQVMMPKGTYVRRYDLALNQTLTALTGKDVHVVFATIPNQWCVKKLYPDD